MVWIKDQSSDLPTYAKGKKDQEGTCVHRDVRMFLQVKEPLLLILLNGATRVTLPTGATGTLAILNDHIDSYFLICCNVYW